MRFSFAPVLLAFTVAGVPTAIHAQTSERPPAAAEFTVGYAGFVDDVTIDHTMIGGALRVYLSPRISIGPEIQYMVGPGDDRDVIATGNVTFDVLPPDHRITPFLVAGGGLYRHVDKIAGQSFSSHDPAFTAGGGVRAWIGDRVSAAGEFRAGWELDYRVSGTIGVTLSR